MSKTRVILLATIVSAFSFGASAHALTMKECSVKYQAAKTDGSLKGMNWKDFRAKNCGATAAAEETDDPAVSEVIDEEPAKPTVAAPKGVSFPSKVAAKYSSEAAGKARMHTCVDAYHANKDAKTLNGLKWIQKGGGFYSLCNAKLKTKG